MFINFKVTHHKLKNVAIPEAATRDVLQKKLFLKIQQYSQENTCDGVSFLIDLRASRPATFLERDSNTGRHLCWSIFLRKLQALKPVNLLKDVAKFLRTLFWYKSANSCFCSSCFLLLIFLFGWLFLLLIHQAVFKGPLQGLKSSPQGVQWQAPPLLEKKKKNQPEWSLVDIRCHSLYHSLSLDVPLVCLFINDLHKQSLVNKAIYRWPHLYIKT